VGRRGGEKVESHQSVIGGRKKIPREQKMTPTYRKKKKKRIHARRETIIRKRKREEKNSFGERIAIFLMKKKKGNALPRKKFV